MGGRGGVHEWEGREGYMSGRAGRGAQMGGRGRVHEWEGGEGCSKVPRLYLTFI